MPDAPTDSRSVYAAEIVVQMLRDWTRTPDLTASRRDRIVLPQAFDATPPEDGAADDSDHVTSD